MAPEDELLSIQYPKDGERILSSEYTFRIITRLPGPVEVRIDEGLWWECRSAVGYWWYDWVCEGEGTQRISARARGEGGKIFKADSRRFIVECGRGKGASDSVLGGAERSKTERKEES